MRRGMGLAGIKLQKEKEERLKKMGAELEANLISDLKNQFIEFKANLEKFAVRNKKQINEDPVFRRQFHQMCLEIGVDPISSQKGHLGGTLGLGSFYYELGIQVTNICIALKKKTGGFVEMSDCMKYLQHLRGSAASKISEEDITSAIKQLQVLGPALQLINVDNKQYISSVPMELNEDHKLLISLGEQQGFFSESMAVDKLKISLQRVQEAVKILISEGIVWIDEPCFVSPEPGQKIERLYWFPNMLKKSNFDLSIVQPNK
eukprot:TRINITY_DN72038_c0_g1_i1.p1 TRINITY_DN72038_c0_g1~~TRINITY_DN72038_c0_g1_i1.p1  ORF type:complete len:289 (-),score=33.76 TRINITY_DN72038_c0_g1_i1:85-870(-)